MRRVVLSIVIVLTTVSSVLAQGVQTGTIRGLVTDQQDRPIVGAKVTATSDALQAPQSTVTDGQGVYALPTLPAGTYVLSFESNGLKTGSRTVRLPLGLTAEQNVVLTAATVTETVNVVGLVPPPIANAVVGANFTHDRIDSLATPRTLEGIAQLSPGLNEAGPQNNNQVVINGAFAYDNVFMINGVDVNDNLFAQPQNLFVEDAIEETQVLTSGISAEYGRFTGGVINAVTKSGGNRMSGSGRINFTNPAWTTATPFEVFKGSQDTAHPSSVQESYEGTFGGPLAKDRLWFFASGRNAVIDSTRTLTLTGLVLPTTDTNRRGEIKLTGRLAPNQTLQGGFFTSPRTQTNTSGAQNFVITPDSEDTPKTQNWYTYANYHGILQNRFVIEGQYSLRRWKVDNPNANSTNLLNSPFLSATQCACLYNAPYFDATDSEQRNNAQVTGSATDFWSGAGSHQSKVGYEFYRSERAGGGSQSPTSYVFNSDYATGAGGPPLLDASGHVVPSFVPGVSSVDFYPATRGSVLDIDTQSVYVQDHWMLNRRWSADLGARFEHVKATSTGGIIGVDNHRLVPRLAAAWDLSGNGQHVVHATYGWYSGRYDEALIGANSPVANPAQLTKVYTGPAGQGKNFAPGFDLANYPVTPTSAAKVPTANVFLDPNLRSPIVREFTASFGQALGGRGYAEASYVHRRTVDLIEDFQTLAGGTTNVVLDKASAGQFTNIVYKNTDLAHRVYDALEFQSQYQFTPVWTVNGHYTLELRNEGNYEGEAAGQPGKPSFIGNFPEAFSAARNFPDGNLQSFERNRFRLWTVYEVPMQRYGSLSFSGLWRVDSALTYSLRAIGPALTATQTKILAAAGYPDAPSISSTSGYFVYFGDRGSQQFKGYGVFDTSVHYDIPVFRSLRPWLKLDVYNLFNNQKLIAWSVAVKGDPTSPKDSLGLPTGYVPSNVNTFGTATGNTISLTGLTVNSYPVAYTGALPGGRTFQMALGFRF